MNKLRPVRFKKKLNDSTNSDAASLVRGPATFHDGRVGVAVNLTTMFHKTRTSNTLKFSLIASAISLTIIISGFHQANCQSIESDLHPEECKLDTNHRSEVIKPMVVVGNASNSGSIVSVASTVPLSSEVSCQNTLRVAFSSSYDEFVIDLVKNKRLISDRYFKISKDAANRHGRHPDASSNDSDELDGEERFHKNHLFLNLHNFTTNDEHCHYHGFVNENLNSISAISIVDRKLLSGFFHDGKDVYYLHANVSNSSTVLTRSSDLCRSKHDILRNNESRQENSNSTLKNQLLRSRRDTRRKKSTSDNYIMHEPFQSNSSSLFVELLIVHDHSQYMEYKGNTSNIAERTMQVVNIMNAFYRPLNIFIALVGVVLWVEKDEIILTEDGDATLNNFLKYRFEKLLPKYHHDNAQLITSTSFNGSVVGKALKGPICTHEHSGGVNTDHSHSPAVVAVTLAHELGHNFGMEHDEDDKCKCPDEKCIMSSSSSTVHPKHWSSCSIDYLRESRKHGLLDCLKNRPDKAFGPVCGNGFVEEGEDCDLGELIPTFGTSRSRKTGSRCLPGKDCDLIQNMNPCCDRQTCKFTANATCAQGPCCDLAQCSVYNATDTKICRHRQSECDIEEVCDGKNEYCPPDVYYHDGIECGPTTSMTDEQPVVGSASYNRSLAYCYRGKCASHESQCQLLWGESGYVSKDICYEQNVHGNTSGNCGFNRKEKLYESCEPEDAICGMLHCVHNQASVGDSKKTGKLGYGFESASILTVSFFVMSNHAKIFCHGAIVDAGSDARDPGLVPEGAACGENKMCLNQKCVPVSDVISKNWCSSDCNGNGICDNMGTCHCNDGTIGTSCYQFFGSNFHLSLFLYIVMFFLPMIALIVLTINHFKGKIKLWWFLHNRMIALREKGKARLPNQNRRVPYDIDRQQISISEPLPLNQQNSVNRCFFQPSNEPLDCWAETSCEGGKSPGYRLEPIKKHDSKSIGNQNLDSRAGPESLKPGRYQITQISIGLHC